MCLRKITVLLILLFSLLQPVQGGGQVYSVTPTGSNHDQDVINEALEQVHKAGGGIVYLNEGTYVTTGSVIIYSNTVLTGSKDAIIQVSSSSSQWFTGKNSIISSAGPVDNVEIYGFQIDGNCDELPFEYHHSRSDTAHDCERAIYIYGSSSKFCNNIKIHDMQIRDCFSDGIHVRFANYVHCYSDFISNCQHEGIFWVCVINGLAELNKVEGITSDCMRCDNCVTNIIQNNQFLSYTGTHNNLSPEGWHKGLQIADAGSSQGYNAANKPTHTTDIIVRWNTFANTGTQAIWLDSTGKGYDNVHIYDNKFVGVAAVTNNGHDFTLNITVLSEDPKEYNDLTVSIEPSLETTEYIFDSIFNVMYLDFVEHAGQNYSVIFPEGVSNTPSNITATITKYEDIQTLVYVPSNGLTSVTVTAGNNTSSHVVMLGEKKGLSIIYNNVSIWNGAHSGDSFYFDGCPENIQITCNTPKGSFEPKIVTENIEIHTGVFNPIILLYFIILFFLLGSAVFTWWVVFKWR